jgi:hypothetical protein
MLVGHHVSSRLGPLHRFYLVPLALRVLRTCAVRMIEGIVGPLYAIALLPAINPSLFVQQYFEYITDNESGIVESGSGPNLGAGASCS